MTVRLPIQELSPGEIAPPMEPDHPSWRVLSGWEDPLAPRAGYRVPSGKTRVEYEGEPALQWNRHANMERALVTGEPTWRECSVTGRLQALQTEAGPTNDAWFASEATAGVVFRVETSRRYYHFCLQGRRRAVLIRRIDDEWFELAAAPITYADRIVTLRVDLDGDGIRATCPELDVDFFATDTTIQAGRAGFRALGACRVFDLAVTVTDGQQRTNGRRAAAVHVTASVPQERQVGEIDVADGRELVEASAFAGPDRCDLLFRTADALVATGWNGEERWRLPQRPAHVKVAAEPVDGSRRIYALVGERQASDMTNVGGAPMTWVVADELIALDGKTGAVLYRQRLPNYPDPGRLGQFDVSFETGRLVSPQAVDIVVRTWRSDLGHGGTGLWADDGELNLLWQRDVDPPYGHHNAVHLVDVTGDGRSDVLAGGTLLTADGEVLWRHDLADQMGRITGAHHYDAAIIGHFADDPGRDPIAFLVGGSAGVYVVDGSTGRTRAVHRIGHAQWTMPCRVRDDLPGTQVLAGTRWGNFGILTLFSGRGDRLWTIQPDYFLQGTGPVQWTPEAPELVWLNTSRDAQGLYDGDGRLVQPLEHIRRLWGERTRMDVKSMKLRRAPTEPDVLAVEADGRIHLFAAR